MNIRSDIAVYDSDGNLALVVEIKNKRGTTQEWATTMRRNMVAHGFLPTTSFFLLALPDRFYLWKNTQLSDLTKNPDYEIDSTSFLQPYFQSAGVDLPSLSSSGFELLLVSWLRELVRGTDLADELAEDEANDWLIESGLLEAIKQGNVVSEAVL